MVTPKYPPPVLGGLENQAHELAKALIRKGLSVHALSTRFDPSHRPAEVIDGVKVHRIDWSEDRLRRFLTTPLPLFQALWRMRKEVDVVHLHQSSPFNLITLCAAKLLGKPVLTKLANVGEYGLPGMKRGRFGRLRLVVLLRSKAIVAMSTISVSELRDVGYPRGRILRTPNGIRLSSHDPDTDGCTNGVCRVVFVGRLSPEKRVDVLLRSWALANPQFKQHAQLEIWGAGPDEARVNAEIRHLQLVDTVSLKGHVADVRHGLPNCDIFVLPSSAEGNSNAVLEAMDARLPVIATAVGGTPMQVGPEGADLLVAVDDASALADRLVRLVNDSTLRRAYGDAMRKRVEAHFDMDRVAEGYICAYRKLAAGGQIDLSQCGSLPEGDELCAE